MLKFFGADDQRLVMIIIAILAGASFLVSIPDILIHEITFPHGWSTFWFALSKKCWSQTVDVQGQIQEKS